MNENADLQILIETALDFEKSLAMITAQMNQLREKFKSYQIQITASLNQTASAAQIKTDLKQLNTIKNHVRLVGQMDQAATQKNVDGSVKKLKNTEVQLTGLLDPVSTQKNIQEQLRQIPQVDTDVNVEGAEQINLLSQKMDRASNSASGMAAKVYLARTALQALRRAAQEAKDTVVELDKAATDLAIVTGSGSEEAYALIKEYNQMAQQLGATTTQISDAATEWLRQGKTAEETTALIEQSMILSKVGAMDAETATQNLTSAMKGYGLAVENVSGIVDKLTAIDLKAAVTASDLAVAMSRTANSANISGVGMDRLLGYLATVEEVTQKSAETIGESFKTIFARMGNIKLGNYLDDEGEDLSDVETVLKSFGIALRNAEGDFRDFSDVLDDVYAKWNQFGAIDKRAVANAFAGTRQQENFLVLMENYGKALEYAGIAANSAGTSLEKFAAYEDSVEAKAASFTAALESLTMDTIDSDLVKDLIDAGTAVIEFAEQTGLLKTTLASLGTGVAIKGVKLIADGFDAAKQSALSLGTAINTLRKIEDVGNLTGETLNRLGGLTKGLNDEQLKLVLTSRQLTTAQMETILVASGLSEQEVKQKLATLGLAASQSVATEATWSWSAAMTGLGASIKAAFAANPVGMTALTISALFAVVNALSGSIKTASERIEDLQEKIRETNAAIKETGENLRSLSNDFKDIIPRFLELYEKAGSFGDQGTLSDDEYQEFLSLQNQIADMFPEIDAGIDSNGNHMLALSGDVDTLRQSFERLLDTQRKAYQQEIVDKYDESLPDYEQQEKEYQKLIQNAEKHKDEFQNIYQEIVGGQVAYKPEDVGYLTLLIDQENLKISDTGEITIDFDLEAMKDDLDAKLRSAVDALDAGIANYNREIEASWRKLSSNFAAIMYSETSFDDLDEVSKNLAEKMASAFNVQDLFAVAGGSDSESIGAYFQREVVDPLSGVDLSALSNEFKAGNISVEEFSTSIKSAYSELKDANASKAFVSAMNANGASVNTFDEALNYLIRTLTVTKQEATDTASSGLEELKNALGDTASDLEKVQKVIETINNGGFNSLTEDDFSDLLSVIPELKTELTAYYNAVQAGNDPIEEQTLLLEKLHGAAKDFTKSKISEALSDAADAANEFGSDSYQAQTAMRVLSQYAPKTTAALYDEETGMYKLGTASEYTAEAILAVAKANLSSSIEEMKNKLSELEAAFYATAISARTMRAAMEISDLKDAIREATSELDTLGSVKINVGGGGSSSTPAEKIKDDFDKLNSSIEHSIFLQEQYYEQAKENLDSTAMRSALIRQIGYYQQIQTESHKAAEQLRAYYKSQGMTAAAIEAQSDIQALSKTWWEAAESIKDAATQIREDIAAAFSDAVDEIQDVYDALHDAANEYAESGYVAVDALQSIRAMGVQYLAFLEDEGGQLTINEERIRDIIAARTQQMAVESALSYVESLRAAKMSQNIEELNNLLYATQEVTDATWGYVYASLGLLGLSDDQYQAALQNINALRALSESAINSIGNTGTSVTDTLTKMQEGLNDILEYVMDMIKQEIENQTDAIEKQKDAYSDLIEMKKASLDASKEEGKYTKEVAEKVKELAKLQAQYDLLDLDDSREAQAQKATLLEEMAKLQDELAEMQADHAYDTQVDALDDMEEAYHAEKDKEIEILEDSISSYQKLYDKAISYIQDNWDTLYESLINWNTQYGDVLNSEITSTWENCLAAAQRYGNYVSALNGIQGDIDASGSGNNTAVGNTNYDSSYNNDDLIKAIVNRMKINSADWFAANDQGKEDLANENKALAAQLSQFGINAVLGNGVWYIDRVGGEKLYEKYHTGGIVGGGTLKENEQIAVLEKKEWILSETMVDNLVDRLDGFQKLSTIVGKIADIPFNPNIERLSSASNTSISRILNDNRDSRRIEISIGDTYISGTNEETVRKHTQINKQFMDDLARQLGAKW